MTTSIGEERAFVAGATGYTGREVVRALRDRGIATVAHVRPDSSALEQWRQRFEELGAQVDTTAWDEQAMAATLGRLEPTHVFALLGTTQKRGRAAERSGSAAETYETVDYGLSALLMHAARSIPTPPRFIYLSSMGVGPRSRSPYMKVRHRMETELRASGLPYTVARPSFITGEDRDEGRPLERAGAAATDAALAVVGALGARRLRNRYRSTTNAELAEALVAAALDPASANTTLERDSL